MRGRLKADPRESSQLDRLSRSARDCARFSRTSSKKLKADSTPFFVAINKDKDANIFSVARFGVVGDYKQILPALTAKLKELKSA
jgi:hypothetical protein